LANQKVVYSIKEYHSRQDLKRQLNYFCYANDHVQLIYPKIIVIDKSNLCKIWRYSFYII